MNKQNYWNNCLYPLFLSTLNSCTFASFTDQELQDEIDNLAIRAVAKFKFPKVSLEYAYDDSTIDELKPVVERQKAGYYFINDVTIKELLVLVSWMKVFWVEYQLSRERNYESMVLDKDVKGFSNGNLISNIEKVYNTMRLAARKDEEDYGRVNAYNKPAIGDINV